MSETLDILICTIDGRIADVPRMLLPAQVGVRWIVSMQYTDKRFLQQIPTALRERADVHLLLLPGRGLSRNRNNALAFVRQTLSDISTTLDSNVTTQRHYALISDDDVRYTQPRLQELLKCLGNNQQTDIALFETITPDGTLLKNYPRQTMTYREAMAVRKYYPSSVEIVLGEKAIKRLHFDERFGLGSSALSGGEEHVLMHDALQAGLDIRFFPIVVAQTDPATTGSHFLTDIAVQRAKGAVFAYTLPRTRAYYAIAKEVLHHLIYNHANPFPLLRHMHQGATLISRHKPPKPTTAGTKTYR